MSQPRRVLCTPVGPAGLKPEFVLMSQALVYSRVVLGTMYSESHTVPARNGCWQLALKHGAERALWCDADVVAEPHQLAAWLHEQDDFFDREPSFAAVGAAVARRGGGQAFDFDPARDLPLYLGMGLTYWHVPRVLAALRRGARPEEYPFQWLPPWSEDFDVSRFLEANGARQSLETSLPTEHLGVGTWRPTEGMPRRVPMGEVKP